MGGVGGEVVGEKMYGKEVVEVGVVGGDKDELGGGKVRGWRVWGGYG